MNDDCIFCKIATDRFSSWKIFENDTHTAFLTPYPNTPGFTVVIPKAHESSDVLSLDDQTYQELLITAKEVAARLKRSLQCKRVGLVAEGMGVDHAHVKLIPMHGIPEGPWKPILSHRPEFNENYEGFLSTHDGPRMADEELTRIQGIILNDK